jgi:PncC family amidohydrolase
MPDDIANEVKELAELFRKKKLTLSLAESCTGGKIAALITTLPGASDFFTGSAVTYSNESKEKILCVPPQAIASSGAVSADTAIKMAEGARAAFGSDIAAAATGIAGPGGGTEQKPVGTVFAAVTNGKRGRCEGYLLKGSREEIRDAVAKRVIKMLMNLVGEM